MLSPDGVVSQPAAVHSSPRARPNSVSTMGTKILSLCLKQDALTLVSVTVLSLRAVRTQVQEMENSPSFYCL